MRKELSPPYTPEIGDDFKYFDSKLTSKLEFDESVIDPNNRNLIKKNENIFK